MNIIPSGIISEFIKALDEEIEEIKAGKSSSAVRVFDGKFIREDAGVFIYSFVLENLITAIDDAPVEIRIGETSCKGQIIQTQGLEVVVGLERKFGDSITEAILVVKLYFLYEMLKKRFEMATQGKMSIDFGFSDFVFEGGRKNSPLLVKVPPLEASPRKFLNESQKKAVELALNLPLSFVWGPPGTGKTATLARIVECFLKRGMKVLVVSHANTAVDEAMEEIADILKFTDFYKQGRIIRFGNIQKETLKKDFPLVIMENIVKMKSRDLENRLKRFREELSAVEEEVERLAYVKKTVLERERLMEESRSLETLLVFQNRKVSKIEESISKLKKRKKELKNNLKIAQSSSFLKRIVLGLHPSLLQSQIENIEKELNSLNTKAAKIKGKLIETQKNKLKIDSDFDAVCAKYSSMPKELRMSKRELKSKENNLDSKRKQLRMEIKKINDELKDLKKEILGQACVIATTLTKTFSAKDFPDINFEVLIIDEASMAPLPYIYWALSRCSKAAVIVGDFLQLPPICISDKHMARKWLGRNIYNHLNLDTVSKVINDSRVCLLDQQYRMNPIISRISNDMFYKGLLKNDLRTENFTVHEGISNNPLTIIDTTFAFAWCSRSSSGSRFNIYNAALSAKIADKILKIGGLIDKNIGIITPYRLQAKLIGKILKDLGLERKVRAETIHRYQGGEEEVIIFDLVEGPGVKIAPMLSEVFDDSETPLLLNVAMTRAKCKIFLIGNVSYLMKELSKDTSLYKILEIFIDEGEKIDSKNIIDSYFVRDFEGIVRKFTNSFIKGSVESACGTLFSERNFYPFFFKDLLEAKREIIILSPFISSKRAYQFMDLFQSLIKKKIEVKIYTRPPNEQKSGFSLNSAQVVEQFRSIGVEVNERKNMHQKVAIIDRSIAWEGSLNILSHRDTGEQMRRLPFATAVNELIRLCELGEAPLREKQNRKEDVISKIKCSKCGGEMIIRTGSNGVFLSCKSRHCSNKRNIKKWERVESKILCPDCGGGMIVRHGPKGAFLGCSGYPNCKKTLPIR